MTEASEEKPSDISTWSPDMLIARVKFLEQQLKEQTAKCNSTVLSPRVASPSRKPKATRANREFDPSKYSTRLIALKFAYLGQRYNGLEYHPNNDTPLPTVEEKLWQALNKARLVFPTPNTTLGLDQPNWEGCEYSKCGRTDRGVSAFGQVIGIRVRSNCPVKPTQKPAPSESNATAIEEKSHTKDGYTTDPPIISTASTGDDAASIALSASESADDEAKPFHSTKDELPYCRILNRLLPPDIRVLAWCPSPPFDFSARFSCKERRYKYFFTQPAFTPTTGPACFSNVQKKSKTQTERRREGWLDIDAMREAAHKFIGLHDFRNFCKVDPSKQIENFERRIFHADIEKIDSRQGPVGYVGKPDFQQYEREEETQRKHIEDDNPLRNQQGSTPTIYTFTLHGSAFLWHQVRHMVAILFLIGQGLESPSLIDDLLDISKSPNKPQYEMADDAPLVLWDCIFPREGADTREDALKWVYVGDSMGEGAGSSKAADKFGPGGLVDDLWRLWRGRKIDEVLVGSLLDVAVGNAARRTASPNIKAEDTVGYVSTSQRVFQGGDGPRFMGKYVPVMQKPRLDTVEAINARYAKRKGLEQGVETRETGFRRSDSSEG